MNMHAYFLFIAATAVTVYSRSLDSHKLDSSLHKKREVFPSERNPIEPLNITDGKFFNIIFDGEHLCAANNLGPLWGKDDKVKDFYGGLYLAELENADDTQRAWMTENNIGAATPNVTEQE